MNARQRPRGGLLHVLPELLLQEVSEQEEDYQECQHAHAQIAPLELHRLADIVEKIDRVADELVVLLRRKGAWFRQFEFLELLMDRVVLRIALAIIDRALQAL